MGRDAQGALGAMAVENPYLDPCCAKIDANK
jgi:hypothetical protein